MAKAGSMRFILVAVLLLGSCRRIPGPETPITREVMDAGGGDPTLVSPQALRHWFLEHRRFAGHIAGECRIVKEHSLGWSDQTEGRVCAAALEIGTQTAARDHEAVP